VLQPSGWVCWLHAFSFFASKTNSQTNMSIDLKCKCPHCENHIAFPDEAAGQEVTCPHCGKPITLGLNLIHTPLAAMSDEQQEALLNVQVEKLRKERDEHLAKGESWPPSQVKYDQPFPIFTWIQTIVVVVIIAIVAVAVVKFVLFWASQ
jgi:ribosomal protein S27E